MSDEVQALLNEILAEVKFLRHELETAKFKPAQKYVLGGMSIKEWLEKYNPEVSYGAFRARIKRGWDFERAAKAPIQVSEDDLTAWKESLRNEKSK